MRLLPRTPRGTWLLAGAVWLAGVGALWWVLPYRPRAEWPTEKPAVVHGFIPGTPIVLTSPYPSESLDWPGPLPSGPLQARDAATGEVQEWLPDREELTLVDPGVDGRHVLIGRFVGGQPRLFLHNASGGAVIAELPRVGLQNLNPNDGLRNLYVQFAAFRPDGRQIVYADDVDDRRRLRVRDVETSKEVAFLPDAGPPVAWSPDRRSLAYCTRTGNVWSVRLWDLSSGQTRALVAALPAYYEPNDLAFSPNRQKLAARVSYPSDIKPIRIHAQVIGWDVATGRETYRVANPGLRFPMEATSFIAAGGTEPSETAIVVRRLDYDSGSECGRFTPPAEVYMDWYALSPPARLYFGLTRHENRFMELFSQRVLGRPPGEFTSRRPLLFDSETGQTRHRLPMALDTYFVRWSRSQWSPDGTLLAIAGNEQVAVWDIPPRRPLSWFATGAVLFAVPTFLIARRRVRRLREAAA